MLVMVHRLGRCGMMTYIEALWAALGERWSGGGVVGGMEWDERGLQYGTGNQQIAATQHVSWAKSGKS